METKLSCEEERFVLACASSQEVGGIAMRYRTSGMGAYVYGVVHALSLVWYGITGIVHIVLCRR